MRKIETRILDATAVSKSERMMLAAARLTQRGHEIHNMSDFMKLYNKKLDFNQIESLAALPHPTLQKFGVINVAVVGLSRRALAQITRHQNEVKFMGGSLQYSDYSAGAGFVTPPGLSRTEKKIYKKSCEEAFEAYTQLREAGVSPDAAGYVMPQGFRTILLISATPYQWKHMIGQRVCRRNTPETRYVFLKIWKDLVELAPELFWENTGPGCMQKGCLEGRMSCGNGLKDMDIDAMIKELEEQA